MSMFAAKKRATPINVELKDGGESIEAFMRVPDGFASAILTPEMAVELGEKLLRSGREAIAARSRGLKYREFDIEDGL